MIAALIIAVRVQTKKCPTVVLELFDVGIQ
jgi:hypothetical protein